MQDAFYVLDLGLLVRLFQEWVQAMPRVKPFYAVKCSPDPALLTTLAALGAGFDCASKAEIAQVLDLGVSTERIVFANPCKIQSHVAYAASVGVNIMTFDSESEVPLPEVFSQAPTCLWSENDTGGLRYCFFAGPEGESESPPGESVAANQNWRQRGSLSTGSEIWCSHERSGEPTACCWPPGCSCCRYLWSVATNFNLFFVHQFNLL